MTLFHAAADAYDRHRPGPPTRSSTCSPTPCAASAARLCGCWRRCSVGLGPGPPRRPSPSCSTAGGSLASSSRIVLAPEEHDELRALPLEQWRALMSAGDFDRLTAVMEARRSGVAAYVGAWDWDIGPDGPVTHAGEAAQ